MRVYCWFVGPLQCELNENETVMLPSPVCLRMKVILMCISVLSTFVLCVRGSIESELNEDGCVSIACFWVP